MASPYNPYPVSQLESYTNEMYAEAEIRGAAATLFAMRREIEKLKEILEAAPDAVTMGMRLDTTKESPEYYWPEDRCTNCGAVVKREANWYRSL
jgi:hypothetical protein